MAKQSKPKTAPSPILIPRLYWNTLQEVSVGLLRVSEQLDVAALSPDGVPLDSIRLAHEVAMWSKVTHGLMERLDTAIDRFEPESDAATDARAGRALHDERPQAEA